MSKFGMGHWKWVPLFRGLAQFHSEVVIEMVTCSHHQQKKTPLDLWSDNTHIRHDSTAGLKRNYKTASNQDVVKVSPHHCLDWRWESLRAQEAAKRKCTHELSRRLNHRRSQNEITKLHSCNPRAFVEQRSGLEGGWSRDAHGAFPRLIRNRGL